MKVTDLIRNRHPELLGGLDQALFVVREDVEGRKQALRAILIRLDAHWKAEEQTIFPAFIDEERTRMGGLRAREEHVVLWGIMGVETLTEVQDAIWQPRLEVLRDFIEMHRKHEVLKAAEERLPSHTLKTLRHTFAVIRDRMREIYIVYGDCGWVQN